ncbi:MAG: response regulator [Candidatus Altiarchaeota archaeon]|nr:response regulator [Candidatus Altiarchaeota archaeon]
MAKPKVLLADDSAFMRNMLKTMLSEEGYRDIVEAQNGTETVEVYKKERPGIVLLDIIMAEKDGLQVLAEIMKIDPKAVIVMVTAIGHGDPMKEAMRIGAKAYVTKPFKREQILDVVRRFS